MSKQYLYTIVNTLDCSFFVSVEKEVEMKLASLKKQEAPAQIKVDPNMLALIE